MRTVIPVLLLSLLIAGCEKPGEYQGMNAEEWFYQADGYESKLRTTSEELELLQNDYNSALVLIDEYEKSKLCVALAAVDTRVSAREAFNTCFPD